MNIFEPLNKRRDELAHWYMEFFRRVDKQNDHLHSWVAAKEGYIDGINTLALTWVQMYEALKDGHALMMKIAPEKQALYERSDAFKALIECEKFLNPLRSPVSCETHGTLNCKACS